MINPMYTTFPEKLQQVGYWLLTLKPGEYMELPPSVFGVRAETLQSYVNRLNGIYGRRYRTYGGLTKNKDGTRNHKPNTHSLTVHFLGTRV